MTARGRDRLGRPVPSDDPAAVRPVPEQALPPAAALALAQSLLDEGRAFGAHEVLEASWKAAPVGERDLWQGLAQLCVGVTHLQRGNTVGAVRLLRRAALRLPPAPAHRVDPGLAAWALALAAAVEAAGAAAGSTGTGGTAAGRDAGGGPPWAADAAGAVVPPRLLAG